MKEVVLDADPSAWNGLEVSDYVRMTLLVENVQGSINEAPPLVEFKTAIWQRAMVLARGTHAGPPRLGSGFWISDQRPNTGL